MLKFNGKVMKFGNVWGCGHKEPEEDAPATSVPTAQGTATSSAADLISQYNSANTVDKYTLKSDFTFKGV